MIEKLNIIREKHTNKTIYKKAESFKRIYPNGELLILSFENNKTFFGHKRKQAEVFDINNNQKFYSVGNMVAEKRRKIIVFDALDNKIGCIVENRSLFSLIPHFDVKYNNDDIGKIHFSLKGGLDLEGSSIRLEINLIKHQYVIFYRDEPIMLKEKIGGRHILSIFSKEYEEPCIIFAIGIALATSIKDYSYGYIED